jgi:8-amino-7-oxononanoate synthase
MLPTASTRPSSSGTRPAAERLLDFTAALYLGLRHPSSALGPWLELTTGTPAALGVPVETAAVAERLAALLGTARATLSTSTLHLFWDLFVLLAWPERPILVDAGAYAIAQWGVERAQARGARVQRFAHHDPDALASVLAAGGRRRRPSAPLVLADGLCPECGVAPLREYSELAQRAGGTLVIDDTQAVGILGEPRANAGPFGAGGGGAVRWHGIAGPHVVLGASLAKGFGAPIAVLAADGEVVTRFERSAETRVFCSPPATASVRAAAHALRVNRCAGDMLRTRLASLVRRFRSGLADVGLRPPPTAFPVQTVVAGAGAIDVHDRLRAVGVEAVLHRGHDRRPRVSLLITAAHREAEIDAALDALRWATRGAATRRPSTVGVAS